MAEETENTENTEEQVEEACSFARAERILGREYHGRFLIELLQNAADAWRATRAGTDRTDVRIVLSKAPALLVANARVDAASSAGRRSLPLDEFLVDRKRTALAPNELVTSISLERPGARTGEIYLKVGRRAAMEVALVGLAVCVRLDEDDAIADARIAVCAVGPKAVRVHEAEAALAGTRGEDAAVAEAGSLLQGAARPIDDVRGTARYRSRVLPGLLARAVAASVERARS